MISDGISRVIPSMDSRVEHMFSVEAMVCGYHKCQSVWDAPIGVMLRCEREVGNIHDTFAVAITQPTRRGIFTTCGIPRDVAFPQDMTVPRNMALEILCG